MHGVRARALEEAGAQQDAVLMPSMVLHCGHGKVLIFAMAIVIVMCCLCSFPLSGSTSLMPSQCSLRAVTNAKTESRATGHHSVQRNSM